MVTLLLKTPLKRSETLHILVHWSLAGWVALLINAWQIINKYKNCPGTLSFPSVFTDFGWTSVLNNYHFTHICLDKDFRVKFQNKISGPRFVCILPNMFSLRWDNLWMSASFTLLWVIQNFPGGKLYAKEPLLLFLSCFSSGCTVYYSNLSASHMASIESSQLLLTCGLKKMKRKKQEIFSS